MKIAEAFEELKRHNRGGDMTISANFRLRADGTVDHVYFYAHLNDRCEGADSLHDAVALVTAQRELEQPGAAEAMADADEFTATIESERG